jgi:hypothetical protein
VADHREDVFLATQRAGAGRDPEALAGAVGISEERVDLEAVLSDLFGRWSAHREAPNFRRGCLPKYGPPLFVIAGGALPGGRSFGMAAAYALATRRMQRRIRSTSSFSGSGLPPWRVTNQLPIEPCCIVNFDISGPSIAIQF